MHLWLWHFVDRGEISAARLEKKASAAAPEIAAKDMQVLHSTIRYISKRYHVKLMLIGNGDSAQSHRHALRRTNQLPCSLLLLHRHICSIRCVWVFFVSANHMMLACLPILRCGIQSG
jgi:hypothetical protein